MSFLAFWDLYHFEYYILYSFPIAAATNYTSLSGLKQYKLFSLFWRSAVLNKFHQVKVKVLAGLVLLETLGENPFSCLF